MNTTVVPLSGRVLFADDDDGVLAPTSDALRAMGFDVESVCTANEASEALSARDFDVMLLDINMPGNEQLQFVRDLSDGGRFVPVVLLTGYPSMDSAVEALRLGVVDYVIKPPKIPELCNRLSRAITRGAALRVLTSAEQRVAELSDWIDSLKSALLMPPPSLTPPSHDHAERRGAGLDRLDLQQLSTREREVLDDLARGRQAQEIAANLGVSISTVRTHIRSIFVKLKVNSQLALLAKLVSEAPLGPPSRRS